MLTIALLLAAADVTTPVPGVTHIHQNDGTQDWHLLGVDLCQPGISIRTTGDGERGRVVSSFGELVGAAAAVNGDFFGGGFNTDGPAAHDGAQWSGSDHTYVAPIAFGAGFVDMPHHNNELGVPFGASEVVSGHPTLLDDGVVVGNPGDPLCTNRHPRTALGLSEDRRTLLILVVDGRRSGAIGMTCDEMAGTLAFFGAFDAVNLDGGGSSTMWVGAEGGVQNRPSDGSQRTVANHLAVIAAGTGIGAHCPGPPPYRAEFVSQTFPPAHIEPLVVEEGAEVEGTIELRNTGSETWTSIVRLAPTPRDVASSVAAASWQAAHRIGPAEADTPPDGVGRFTFRIRGNTIGTYDQTFGLVAEGVTWFADQGGPSDNFIRVIVNVVPATITPPPPDPDPAGEGEVEEPGEGEGESVIDDPDLGDDDDDELPTGDPDPLQQLPPSTTDSGCAAGGAPLTFVLLPLVIKRVRRGRRRGCSGAPPVQPMSRGSGARP